MQHTIPLLSTKLNAPRLSQPTVTRPHLIDRLNAGLNGFLTMLSAPAGFGKTTLLGEWSSKAQPGVRFAWLTLDERDNDPVRFVTYLSAALRGVDGRMEPQLPARLRAAQQPAIEPYLVALINQLEELTGGPENKQVTAMVEPRQTLVLILDDYHVIGASEVHRAVDFVLKQMPANLHLVIATRIDPPLHLARLRGRGQLNEFRSLDLRFSPGEAAVFLNRAKNLDLSAEAVSALAARTEGWIAGLQMAAISMEGRDDPMEFIKAFTGSNRYVLDFLFEEVLDRQPEDVQSFLLKTSVLGRLSGSLCDALCQVPDGPADRHQELGRRPGSGSVTLQRLESRNLFLIPLDDERRWYRYHHLFCEFLRGYLQQVQPGLVASLHLRASEWYEQHAFAPEAVEHALAARDFPRAARLVESAAEEMLNRSEISTFLGWMDALPEEEVKNRPALCLFHAWAMLFNGLPLAAVESRIVDASRKANLFPGQVAALRAFISSFQGQFTRAIELSRQALRQLPEEEQFIRNLVALNLAIPKVLGGNVEAAERAWAEVVKASQQVDNTFLGVVALCQMAEQSAAAGRLGESAAIYRQARKSALDGGAAASPMTGLAMMGLGDIHREWNELDAAAHLLTEGIAMADGATSIMAIDGHIALARTRQAQGDLNAALESIEQAWRLAERFDVTDADDMLVATHEIRLRIARRELGAAARLAERYEFESIVNRPGSDGSDGSDGPLLTTYFGVRELVGLALARLAMANDEPGHAVQMIESLLPHIQLLGQTRALIEALALQAVALEAEGETGLALEALGRVLPLAEAENWMRVFLDEGGPMARLLYRAAAQGVSTEFSGRLLAAFPGPAQPVSRQRQAEGDLIEPLTKRELEVLRLLANGLSNQEVAQQLVVSLATVKWHTRNIYQKLNTKNRTQAVALARTLGILGFL